MGFHAVALAVLVWLVCGTAALAQGQAPACRGVIRPTEVALTVQIDPAAIPLRRDLSAASLAGMGLHLRGDLRLLGLTHSVTAASAEMTSTVVPGRAGQGVCLIPSEIRLTISHAGSWVAVASEVAAGSCRDRIVLEHENQHVKNNRDAVAARLPNLARALRGLGLQPDFPIRGNTVQEATALLQARVQAIVEAELGEMGRIRTERDAALDSPANYAAEDARIQAECGAG